jgi:mono/diheme cytochrome c family protein
MLRLRQIFLLTALAYFSACQPSLERQPKIRTLEEPRTPVAGTESFASNKTKPALNAELIARGQARYQIYCSVCHGLTGAGDGMATQRGFGAPKPFDFVHETRDTLEQTIANGKGRMLGFKDRIPYEDRYAIATYADILSLRAHFPASAVKGGER